MAGNRCEPRRVVGSQEGGASDVRGWWEGCERQARETENRCECRGRVGNTCECRKRVAEGGGKPGNVCKREWVVESQEICVNDARLQRVAVG